MRLTWLCGVSLLVGACSGSTNPFEDSVPSKESLSIKVPSGETLGTSSDGVSRQALIGQRAEFYTATRNATQDFNNGVGGFLAGIEHILTQPPSAQSPTHAMWGPSNDALATANYKFEIEKVAADAYVYQFSGKLKGAPDSDYVAIVQGATHVAGPGRSNGDFHVDIEVARRFDSNPSAEAAITVHFDNVNVPRRLDISFERSDAMGVRSMFAGYAYTENPDGSGTFQFVSPKDVNNDGTEERLAIVSRWMATGQGRADIVASGGSLGTSQAGMSECWSASFARTFFTENGNPANTEGNPATCAF